MPVDKFITLQCSRSLLDVLLIALTQYAHAAYPPGGSECAQASHESLLNQVNSIKQSWQSDQGQAKMNKRIRVMAKSALKYYCEGLAESGNGHAEAREALLLAMIKGNRVSDEQYQSAEQQDKAA